MMFLLFDKFSKVLTSPRMLHWRDIFFLFSGCSTNTDLILLMGRANFSLNSFM